MRQRPPEPVDERGAAMINQHGCDTLDCDENGHWWVECDCGWRRAPYPTQYEAIDDLIAHCITNDRRQRP